MTLSVLLVENGRTARAVMQKMLTEAGYQVTAVANGQESIDILRKSTFDVVVMDLYMPEMNGTEAARQIRTFSQVPIFALTASQEQQDEHACLEAGMNAFLIKTADQQPLLTALAQLQASKASG